MTRYSRRSPKTGRRKYWRKRDISLPCAKMLSVKAADIFDKFGGKSGKMTSRQKDRS